MDFTELPEGSMLGFVTLVIVVLVAPTWLSWWNSRVARKQLQPNGGSSVLDKINNVTEMMKANTSRIESIEMRQEIRDEQFDQLTVKMDVHQKNFGKHVLKVDEHIEYMNEVHNRTGKKERATDD